MVPLFLSHFILLGRPQEKEAAIISTVEHLIDSVELLLHFPRSRRSKAHKTALSPTHTYIPPP